MEAKYTELSNSLSNYYTKAQVYTKAEVDAKLADYAKTAQLADYATLAQLADYAKTAEITEAYKQAITDNNGVMEAKIKETLDAYDKALADALIALFDATTADNAAAADITEGIGMSDEAIEALKAIKAKNNGLSQEVAEKLNVLKDEKGKQLTSLVFQPHMGKFIPKASDDLIVEFSKPPASVTPRCKG